MKLQEHTASVIYAAAPPEVPEGAYAAGPCHLETLENFNLGHGWKVYKLAHLDGETHAIAWGEVVHTSIKFTETLEDRRNKAISEFMDWADLGDVECVGGAEYTMTNGLLTEPVTVPVFLSNPDGGDSIVQRLSITFQPFSDVVASAEMDGYPIELPDQESICTP